MRISQVSLKSSFWSVAPQSSACGSEALPSQPSYLRKDRLQVKRALHRQRSMNKNSRRDSRQLGVYINWQIWYQFLLHRWREFTFFTRGIWKQLSALTQKYSSLPTQCRSQPKIWGGIWGAKMYDFRQITLFCLEKRLSKHKMTIFSKHFWEAWPLCPPPGYVHVPT